MTENFPLSVWGLKKKLLVNQKDSESFYTSWLYLNLGIFICRKSLKLKPQKEWQRLLKGLANLITKFT